MSGLWSEASRLRAAATRKKNREARKAAGLNTKRTPGELAQEDKKSLRKAINAMCWDCQGGDPGWQWGIANCLSNGKDGNDLCPLHHLRPYQNKEGKHPEGVYVLD